MWWFSNSLDYIHYSTEILPKGKYVSAILVLVLLFRAWYNSCCRGGNLKPSYSGELLHQFENCCSSHCCNSCVYVCVYVCVLIAQSCLALCNPTDCSPPGFSVHGILQARILEWVAIPFPRGSSLPGNQSQVSLLTGRSFNIWPTREALFQFLLVRKSKIEWSMDSNDIWVLIPMFKSHLQILDLAYSLFTRFICSCLLEFISIFGKINERTSQPVSPEKWNPCNSSCVNAEYRLPRWLNGYRIHLKSNSHRRCGFDPWVGKISWRQHGNPLKYSCLENPTDRGAWWAGVGPDWRLRTDAEYIHPVTASVLSLFLVTLWVLVYCSNNLNLLFCVSSFPGHTERECLQDTVKGCQICPFLCVFVHVHTFGCWIGMVVRGIDGWWSPGRSPGEWYGYPL